jgi:hypothetical protein
LSGLAAGNGDRKCSRYGLRPVGRTAYCNDAAIVRRACWPPAIAPVASATWQVVFRCGSAPWPTFEIICEFGFILPNTTYGCILQYYKQ